MEYHFKPIGKSCAATGKTLAPGEWVHSVVVERNGACERIDFSLEGWSGPPEGAIGEWRCRVPEPETRRAAPLDTDGMLRYFEQLIEDANPAHDQLRYVLALFLLQKRRLRLDGAQAGDDGEFLQLSGSRGEGPFQIRDQQLSESEIKRVQVELTQFMDQSLSAA